MNEIDIHINTDGEGHSKTIKIAEDATVGRLLELAQAAGAVIGESGDEIILLVENKEILCHKHRKIHECGIGDGHHVHFKKHGSEVAIWIDKQKFELKTHELTVAQLLELAGDDPKETTLVLKEGNQQVKLADLTKVICLVNGMRFAVYHNEPTPVS
jgi:hypothetical protein